MSVSIRPTSVCLGICLFALFATSAFASQTPPSKGESIGSTGFNDLLGKQVQPGTFATEAQADGSFLLTNKMQTVSAHITKDKAQFDSIGNSKGKGGFGLSLIHWGRDKHLQTVASSKLYRNSDTVYHAHTNGITEKFSNTTNGIQQDFVVASKPEGTGNLHIELQVSDANITAKGTGAIIKLKSGRQLAYDRLLVTDSTNKAIPAHILVKAHNMLDISVDDANAQYPLTIDPTVGSASWVALGSGVNGFVKALAIDSKGNLYVGGGFTMAGGVPARSIAKWDGTTWSALGSGMSGGNNIVFALAVDSHDNLYAGGSFGTAGGVTAMYIAKWNGTAWSALGSGTDGEVDALAIDGNGNLYAGGQFTTAGGVPVSNIAKWNGTAWSALGGGVANLNWTCGSDYQYNDSQVYAMAVDHNNNLYVGGFFNSPGFCVAKWNGSAWSALGSGLGNLVNALAIDGNGNVYAGGFFEATLDGSLYVNAIAKWNGSVWGALGSGVTGQKFTSCALVYYICGVAALAIDSNGNVYASGYFDIAGGLTANYIAEWNGTSWSSLGSGMDWSSYPDVAALAFDNRGNLYAGGEFTTAGGVTANNIAEWKQAPAPAAKLASDFDGDGKSDVLFLNSTTGGTQYWKAATKSQSVYPGAYDTSYTYAGTGDFDGDGKADILFVKSSNNGTLIWNGGIKASATYPGTGATGFSVAAICDTNGDGKADIVWSNATTGGTQIWPSATKASVTYPGVQATGYSVVACGDFDGDGKADLFWRNNLTGADEIWRSGSKSTTTYPGSYNDLTWNVIGAGDVDGDGKADLIWYNSGSGATQVWKSGLKSAASYPGTNATTFTPKAIGDYNGDGKADLLWSNGTTLGTQIWPGVVKASATYPGTYASGFSIQK